MLDGLAGTLLPGPSDADVWAEFPCDTSTQIPGSLVGVPAAGCFGPAKLLHGEPEAGATDTAASTRSSANRRLDRGGQDPG
jgi:hypothetical protein